MRSGKSQVHEVGGQAAKDQNQNQTSFLTKPNKFPACE